MLLKNKIKPTVPQMEPGVYAGVCVGLYGIGEQEKEYKGKTKYQQEIILTFEFPSELIELDGEMQPRQLSRTFSATCSDKGWLRKFLKGWRGKDFSSEKEMANFDMELLLGRACMVNVTLNDNGYANVESVTQLMKGMKKPKPVSPLRYFDIDEWDDEKFESLPPWVQERIKNSMEYKRDHTPKETVDFPANEGDGDEDEDEIAEIETEDPEAEDDDDEEDVPF